MLTFKKTKVELHCPPELCNCTIPSMNSETAMYVVAPRSPIDVKSLCL